MRLVGNFMTKFEGDSVHQEDHSKTGGVYKIKGGATVLKVGDNFVSEASKKNFLTPHLLPTWGT